MRDKVRIKDSSDGRTWRVGKVRKVKGGRAADLVSADAAADTDTQPVDNLVVIADFRDPIYPGLKSTGDRIEDGGDKPFHTVINAENAHALEALSFTHAGKVDCIYIDPPYNTRANDWKYNNDYVDPADTYSHSKWLAFMERRLKLAKKLLNPADSVLIVTIDEKEYLRLGLLLEQTFPDATVQMISSVISPGGVPRDKEFTRVNEFIFFLMFGSAGPVKTHSDMLFTAYKTAEENRSPIWRGLLRGGSGPLRTDNPDKFFPILVDPKTERIVGAGDQLPPTQPRSQYKPPKGLIPCFPLKTGGVEGRWELSRATFDERLAQGYIRLGRYNSQSGQWSVNYLRQAEIDRLATGELLSNGMTEQGYLDIEYAEGRTRNLYAKTVWNEPSHDAGTHGRAILKALIPSRRFDYPKSLYAVEDCLRFFVKDKPNAVILDFFAGSGTTAHAVMRLNRQDSGRRQSISVTNNEVSADEQETFREQGLRPGDAEWEKWGICEYITKPRISAAVTGNTPDSEPIKGDYKFTDEFPMSEGFEENVEFFTLTYEDAEAVRLDLAFTAVAPMLWLRAGGQGSRIDTNTDTFAVADTYGVLFDPDHWRGFVRALEKVDDLRCAYIVTDDDALFQRVTAKLPFEVNGRRLDVVRLYENYLNNFEINTTRV
ncbi:DNA methyltransferase [Mycobacteroides immunogenum]|uniref:site-specific DNA-methyltransferase n=1 Tax=Mycobacteroides immunogenum TaxID=83262 RepID=UPI0025B768A8|nr:DNA methyltransferase [Mycobacteroides immunogenum]WJR35277.1 DNA methyltransferase [Mycobacteroides immunogenum]